MADQETRGVPSPREIERAVEEAGVAKASCPTARLAVLSVLAGVFISFGAAFMLVVRADAQIPFAASQVLSGAVFSLGLFLVLVAGAELFTGDNLMVAGALSGRYGWRAVAGVWARVYIGNLVGALAMALAMAAAGLQDLGSGAVGLAAVSVALGKVSLAPVQIVVRGVLCNILVCLAVWTAFAARDVPGKLACAALPVMGFVAMGFELCVANMFFLPFAMLVQGGAGLAGTVGLAGVAVNLVLATAGNLIGGAVVVGGAYWLAYGRR